MRKSLLLKIHSKAVWVSFSLLVIALLYQILGCIGIVSPISQDTVTNYMMMVINLLAALGIIAEPARKKMQKKKEMQLQL